MLNFSIIESESAPSIQIYIDEQGLARLLKRIEDARRFGHVHLCTPGSGGHDLDDQTPYGRKAIDEVIVDWVG